MIQQFCCRNLTQNYLKIRSFHQHIRGHLHGFILVLLNKKRWQWAINWMKHQSFPDDPMLVVGPSMRVRLPCFRAQFIKEKCQHTGSPWLWFKSLAEYHSGADVSSISLIVALLGQELVLARCILLKRIAIKEFWMWVKILPKNKGVLDERKITPPPSFFSIQSVLTRVSQLATCFVWKQCSWQIQKGYEKT